MMNSLARSVAWVVWSRGIAQVASSVSTLVVARLLGPAEFGLMALASIWTGTIGLLAELGLGGAIVQFPDLEERELNTCFWLALGVAGSGYAALYASAPAIAAWFATPALSDVLRAVGLGLLLVAARIVPDGLLRKRLELDKVSKGDLAAALVGIPVVLGLAWSGAGVWALVAGALVVPLVQTLFSFWFVRWRPGFRLGSRRIRQFLGYSLAALGSRLFWGVYEQTDAFILGKVSGNVVLGLYSTAKNLAMLPAMKVSVVVNQLAGPVMAGLQADRAAMRASFLRGLRLVVCLTVPLCAGLALVADDLVYVALGSNWMPMVPVLQLLCVSGLLRSVDTLFPPVLFARYRASFLCRWCGAVLVVMPFAFWGGAVSMGAPGVALALVVVYPFLAASLIREGLGELEMSWRSLWEELRPIGAAALLMIACVLLVRWTLPGGDVAGRLVRLALASGLGALAYCAVIFYRGGALAREIHEVAGWLAARPHVGAKVTPAAPAEGASS
jgi:O-antigen/teichoic acid export membrane protein